MNYVIIGGGPAGLTAAATLRKLDGDSSITVLSREKTKPYSKMALPYLLAGAVEERHLYLPEPKGVDILPERNVSRIDPGRREVVTAGGETFPFDRLLIASGGDPEKPKIEGGNLPFVFTVRNLPDVKGIQDKLSMRTGRVVIAGAGPVSMETGDALHKLGAKITLVVSSDRVFSTMLDLESSEIVERKLREQGIEVLKGQDITKIEPDGSVTLRSGERRDCDIVIFGKGINPCLDFLQGSGITMERGITVDDRQQTNIPGVFAAGDAVESMDIAYGERRVNALWPVAVEQGRVAALNMAGIATAYPGSLARNILAVFGLSIFAAGTGRADGPEVRQESGPDFYHKIVLDRGILKGAIVVGDVRQQGLFSSLMKMRADVSDFADSILRGSYDYARYLRRAMKT